MLTSVVLPCCYGTFGTQLIKKTSDPRIRTSNKMAEFLLPKPMESYQDVLIPQTLQPITSTDINIMRDSLQSLQGIGPSTELVKLYEIQHQLTNLDRVYYMGVGWPKEIRDDLDFLALRIRRTIERKSRFLHLPHHDPMDVENLQSNNLFTCTTMSDNGWENSGGNPMVGSEEDKDGPSPPSMSREDLRMARCAFFG